MSASISRKTRIRISRSGIGTNIGAYRSVYIIRRSQRVRYCTGASIHYGMDTRNVLDIVQRWDSLFASFFAVLVILMTIS